MYDEDLKCREANLTFWNVGFPLIFGTFLLIFQIFWDFLIIVGRREPEMRSFSNSQGSKVVVLVLFLGIIISYSIVGMNIYKNRIVKSRGEIYHGTVLGYMNSNVRYNNMPGQICIVEVETLQGRKVIHYNLKKPSKPYNINDVVEVLNYDDIYFLQKCKN
ncbi:MAG: hypothetical protein K6G85_10210 [Eubacterium sp.]|nr:hypothetical protein [Eubacterium sp.]